MDRREFLGLAVAGLCAGAVRADVRRAPRILLRSSWQVVNIGDIAHTPGVLALLEKYVPDAQVTLWASGDLSDDVAAMEHRRFPKLTIVKGSLRDGRATNADLGRAIEESDLLLHGSGPSFVAERDVAAYVAATDKPFGVYGITYGGAGEAQRSLLSRAEFVFFRDSVSLAKAIQDGVASPVMEFGPDGAFACDLRNDDAADAFLERHTLAPQKFLCCIPRLRYTPYWLIRENRPFDAERHRRNEEMQEHDHAPLRKAIEKVVRETDHKILVCPEDMTQMRVGREMIVDKLPEDVRRRVVWRETFWLTDEALSIYRRSSGLFGLEMHSPIMCIGNGVPALVGRFAEQTSKGFMWKDIGLGEWLFDFDRPEDLERLEPAVLSLIADPQAAAEKVALARKFVNERQQATMARVRKLAERAE